MDPLPGDQNGNPLSPKSGHEDCFSQFNGGKMNHIFDFDTTTRLYANRFQSDAAQEALEFGTFYVKIDGSNGLIRPNPNPRQQQELEAYQRLDTRGRPIPEDCLIMPKGQNASTYEVHTYCYEPIRLDNVKKKALKRNQGMLQIVQDHKDYFLSLLLQSEEGHNDNDKANNATNLDDHEEQQQKEEQQPFISIEWIGRKFNKTPGVPYDIAIAIHSEQGLSKEEAAGIDRTYDGIRTFLVERVNPSPIEGLIVNYQGLYWKIRSDCFDKKCLFKTNPELGRPPIKYFVAKETANSNEIKTGCD